MLTTSGAEKDLLTYIVEEMLYIFSPLEDHPDGVRFQRYSEVSWKESPARQVSLQQKYTTDQQGDIELVTEALQAKLYSEDALCINSNLLAP